MTVIALGSIAGAPGVTSLAVGLAGVWPDDRRRVVVEADPAGGRLGAQLGIGVEPGLMTLALAARSGRLGADELLVAGAAQVGSWFAVPAPASGEQTWSALSHAGAALAELMGVADGDVWIVDAGRLSTRSAALPFARVADHTVLVTGGSFDALQLVPDRVDALRRVGCRVGVVVVEPTDWSSAELAEFAGADVLAVMRHVRGGRATDLRSMRGAAWRRWWHDVERLAVVLDGDEPPVPPVPAGSTAPSDEVDPAISRRGRPIAADPAVGAPDDGPPRRIGSLPDAEAAPPPATAAPSWLSPEWPG
ncbi:MAG: MinD/ParA family protein [Desertimonas sp.]